MGKEKGYNSSHVYCQAKGWSKRVKKTFSMILERVFKMVWWRGRKWNHIKKDFLSWSVFPSQNIDFPFYLNRLLELFFFPFLYMCFISWGLRGFDVIWGENHFFKNFFSNGLTWKGMVMTMDIPVVSAYSEMELCAPIWLNLDYGDGRVVYISAVDAYFGVEVCTPIFLGEARKQFFLSS
jgi:hypothetical protein